MKDYIGVDDKLFKAICLDKKNKLYVRDLIHMITGISLKELTVFELVNTELPSKNKNNKALRNDILVKSDKHLFLIEMNKSYYPELNNRNYGYLYKVGTTLYDVGEKKFDDRKLYLINLDYFDYYKNGKLVNEANMLEIDSLQIDNKNLKSFHVNLKHLEENCYNKDIKDLTKLEKYLKILTTDDNEVLEQLGKEDVKLKKVKETIEEYNRNKYEGIFDYFPNEYFDECERRYQCKLARDEGRAEGIALGEAKGVALGIRTMARNMYQNNVPTELILKSTGYSQNEFNQIIGILKNYISYVNKNRLLYF